MSIDQKSKPYICDLEQLQNLAQNLASQIKPPLCIELRGDLGSGKTTFVKLLGMALGVTQLIISPTYAIHQTYVANNAIKIEHFDLYRVSHDRVVEEELRYALDNKKAITLVEWARHGTVLPKDRLVLEFDYIDEGHRQIIMSTQSQKLTSLIEVQNDLST